MPQKRLPEITSRPVCPQCGGRPRRKRGKWQCKKCGYNYIVRNVIRKQYLHEDDIFGTLILENVPGRVYDTEFQVERLTFARYCLIALCEKAQYIRKAGYHW